MESQKSSKKNVPAIDEFVCKLKFRNTLPLPAISAKLMNLPLNVEKYAKFRFISDERNSSLGLESFPMVDIMKTCPADLIYNTIYENDEILEISSATLEPADERLLYDSVEKANLAIGQTSAIQNPLSITFKGIKGARRSDELVPGEERVISSLASNLSISTGQTEPSLQTEEDLLRAIKNTFEMDGDFVHPTDPTLKPVKVHKILPIVTSDTDPLAHLAQCNFDTDPYAALGASKELDNSIEVSLLKGMIKENQKYFEFYRATPGDNCKFDSIREYSYHFFSEEGTTVMIYIDEEGNARYSFIGKKVNLRKRRAATGEKKAKRSQLTITGRS